MRSVAYRSAVKAANRGRLLLRNGKAEAPLPAATALRASSARPLRADDDSDPVDADRTLRLAKRTFPAAQPQQQQQPGMPTVPDDDDRGKDEDERDDDDDDDPFETSSPSSITYTGNATMPITTKLHIVTPREDDLPTGVWPVFRLMVRFGCRCCCSSSRSDPHRQAYKEAR